MTAGSRDVLGNEAAVVSAARAKGNGSALPKRGLHVVARDRLPERSRDPNGEVGSLVPRLGRLVDEEIEIVRRLQVALGVAVCSKDPVPGPGQLDARIARLADGRLP
jgi:hypothetical protein